MKKQLLIFTAISLFLLGCGEAGVEADISKVNEIEFSVSNLTESGLHTEFASVNLAAEEFSDYLNDIESFKVNKIEIQISEVTADRASFGSDGGIGIALGGEILIEASRGVPGVELFADSNGNLLVTDKIVLYDEANPSNVQVRASAAAVDQLISALENRSVLQAFGAFRGEFENANFTVKIFLDLTARTQID